MYVKVVFGNELFNNELIQKSGLTSAILFYNHYHLILNQEKSLGSSLFQNTKVLLCYLLNETLQKHFIAMTEAIVIKFPNYPKLDELLSITI